MEMVYIYIYIYIYILVLFAFIFLFVHGVVGQGYKVSLEMYSVHAKIPNGEILGTSNFINVSIGRLTTRYNMPANVFLKLQQGVQSFGQLYFPETLKIGMSEMSAN